MEEAMQQYLGEGYYPFSPKEFSNLVDIHLGASMIVLMPKTNINLPIGTHVHSSYEFFLPLIPMPLSIVGKNQVRFEVNKLFPINCDQAHGPIEQTTDSRFIAFQFEKEFLQDISKQVYGKRHILFQNCSNNWSQSLQLLLRSFVEESSNRQTGHTFIMESLSTQIAINLFRQLKHNMAEPLKGNFYTTRDNINRAINFLREYYNEDYSLEEVAKIANLSTYHFIRVFKNETGKTPIEYLLDFKIDKAKSLLTNKDKSISEICYDCGFNNPSHFTRVFKYKTGVTPSIYRKNFLDI